MKGMEKMKSWKKQAAFFAAAMLITAQVFAGGAGQRQEAGTSPQATRAITDMGGARVELPGKVTKVIDLWHANNQMVLLLGGADTLIGTTTVVKGLPWFARIYPRISEVKPYTLQTGTGGYNTEEIMMARPDVVIVSGPQDAEILRNAGITTAMVTFRDFDGLRQTVTTTAGILGGNAPAKAEEYLRYLDNNIKRVQDRVKDLKQDEKLKVYEIRGVNPLDTDGRISICTEWLDAAGGINAIAGATDENQATVTMEAVLQANPDVIIVAVQNAAGANGSEAIIERIKTDRAWSSIPAVKNNRIYANPVGTFLWARYSCEEALQVLWTGKILYPDRFRDIDMVKELQGFYKQFYNYDMSAPEAELMLAGKDPQ
ncbi:MAG: ABC transporter substrate-binding protein [Spirochaetaceae bacterium]|jgi:iron complex transport system substrate-binding protein|nr:ABC transporter substrate-binding protein [Spirochaetaceae bacterium]